MKIKDHECNPAPEYLSEQVASGMRKIIGTSSGTLVLPMLSEAVKARIKADGWHLLEEEYYGNSRIDCLVANATCLYVIRNRVRTFKGDSWWLQNCGDLVPPFDWSNDKAIIAWRTSQLKTTDKEEKEK